MHEKKIFRHLTRRNAQFFIPWQKTLQHPYIGYKVQTHQGIINQEDWFIISISAQLTSTSQRYVQFCLLWVTLRKRTSFNRWRYQVNLVMYSWIWSAVKIKEKCLKFVILYCNLSELVANWIFHEESHLMTAAYRKKISKKV